MAITFPRDLPALSRWTGASMDLDRADAAAKESSGKLAGLQLGWPLWRLSLSWGQGLTEAEAELMAAWLDGQRGAQRTFWGYDPTQRNPLSYPNGVSGLARATSGTLDANGDASSWSVNTARDVVTLTGMPNGFRLRPGDIIGWRWSSGAKRTAARCLEDVSATSGGSLAMTIEPPLPSTVPAAGAGCTAHVAQTKVLMRLDPTQTQVDPKGSRRVRAGRLVALQEYQP